MNQQQLSDIIYEYVYQKHKDDGNFMDIDFEINVKGKIVVRDGVIQVKNDKNEFEFVKDYSKPTFKPHKVSA